MSDYNTNCCPLLLGPMITLGKAGSTSSTCGNADPVRQGHAATGATRCEGSRSDRSGRHRIATRSVDRRRSHFYAGRTQIGSDRADPNCAASGEAERHGPASTTGFPSYNPSDGEHSGSRAESLHLQAPHLIVNGPAVQRGGDRAHESPRAAHSSRTAPRNPGRHLASSAALGKAAGTGSASRQLAPNPAGMPAGGATLRYRTPHA